MQATQQIFSIGGLADASGVTVETVRFYQRQGLLAQPERPAGGIRRYGSADIARLRFIKAAQRLGFSLDDVSELLRLDDGAGCSIAQTRAERKLADVRAKLADLRRMEAALADVVSRCATAKGRMRCPLIETLTEAV